MTSLFEKGMNYFSGNPSEISLKRVSNEVTAQANTLRNEGQRTVPTRELLSKNPFSALATGLLGTSFGRGPRLAYSR